MSDYIGFSRAGTTTPIAIQEHDVSTIGHVNDNAHDIVQGINRFNIGNLLDALNISEEYLHPIGDGTIVRNAEEGYEYIDLDDLPARISQQPAVTSNDGLHGQHTQVEEHTNDIMKDSPVLGQPEQIDSSSYCTTSDSEYYEESDSAVTAKENENDRNGQVGIEKEGNSSHHSSYFDLGPRPPYVPTVYDRLRHSELAITS